MVTSSQNILLAAGTSGTNGNVGIGNTSPGSLLVVGSGGNFAVSSAGNLTLTGDALDNGVILTRNGDTVTLDGTPVAGFANGNVGIGKPVNASGYTLGGANATNYSLTQPTLSASITPKGSDVGLGSSSQTNGYKDNVIFTATVTRVTNSQPAGAAAGSVQFRTSPACSQATRPARCGSVPNGSTWRRKTRSRSNSPTLKCSRPTVTTRAA